MSVLRTKIAVRTLSAVATLALTVGLVSVVAPEAANAAVSRATVISRAKVWVKAKVKYNQKATRGGYRTDCSGFVSYTWKLRKPGLTTPSFPGVSKKIAKGSLKKGDILLNKAAGNNGHVAIFEKWANAGKTKYVGYELSGSGMHHRTIPYPYFSGHGKFVPYKGNAVS